MTGAQNEQQARWGHPYTFDPNFSKRVAYFSMEFAIDQALKTYSGGLGFLAGSHMRSAFDLKQNMIGIGILWKYGYYDQVRDENRKMRVQYIKKYYSFLEDTGIKVPVYIFVGRNDVNAMYTIRSKPASASPCRSRPRPTTSSARPL